MVGALADGYSPYGLPLEDSPPALFPSRPGDLPTFDFTPHGPLADPSATRSALDDPASTAIFGLTPSTTHTPGDRAAPDLQRFPSSTSATAPRSASDSASRGGFPSPDSPPETVDRKRKRERNTEAARKYRQRKVDRLTELEDALSLMTQDRDALKLKLARAEAEADVLRGMVRTRG